MKAECSGQPPNQLKTKIDTALSFMADTGKVLFPSFCGTEAFQQKLRTLGRGAISVRVEDFFGTLVGW